MSAGVYYILNTINLKMYIGQSTDIETRMVEQLSMLRNGSSPIQSLRQDSILFGADTFEMGILTTVAEDQERDHSLLRSLESTFMNVYQSTDPAFGYNSKRVYKESLSDRLNREANAAAIKYRPRQERHHADTLRPL